MNVVVTSVLDTSIGIAAALHLAATLPDPVLPCGLATASLLAGDLVREPLMPRGGWLSVPQGPGLGVQLDPAAVRRWCGDAVRYGMTSSPTGWSSERRRTPSIRR